MSWRRLDSRCGDPTAPRKYFVVTMFAALTDQKSGNSTPRCSKLIEPSRQLVMTTSRRSQVTASYGWVPAVVNRRSRRSLEPFLLLVLCAGAPIVSVMLFLLPSSQVSTTAD